MINKDFDITLNHIGSISCNFDADEPAYFELVKLDYTPNHLIQLNDSNILLSCIKNQFFALHDSNLKFIRKIKKIDGVRIKPYGLAQSTEGNLFISSSNFRSTIYKLDCKFQVIKFQIAKNKQFGYIHVYGDLLYACLTNQKQINVFNLDLELVSAHQLEYHPLQIKVTKDRACVLTVDAKKIRRTYFYKLPSFEVVSKINEHGALLVHQDKFYIYGTQNNIHTAYDKNGDIIDRKLNEKFSKIKKYPVRVWDIIGNKLFFCIDKQICISNKTFFL